MIVEMALYGLKLSGSAFREKFAGVLHDLGYMPNKDYPDVWIKPAVNPDGSEYYEIVLCYVDNALVISDYPMKTIDGIQSVFKLKGYKEELPDMYIIAKIQTADTINGTT